MLLLPLCNFISSRRALLFCSPPSRGRCGLWKRPPVAKQPFSLRSYAREILVTLRTSRDPGDAALSLCFRVAGGGQHFLAPRLAVL